MRRRSRREGEAPARGARGGPFIAALIGLAVALASAGACVGRGRGSDFDADGLVDLLEDRDGDFETDVGETDFLDPDSDGDGLCDGSPPEPLDRCIRCEDCDDDGRWEPCLGETNPLTADTDGDGVNDSRDAAPLDGASFDCTGG
jgi:hypothetical protein